VQALLAPLLHLGEQLLAVSAARPARARPPDAGTSGAGSALGLGTAGTRRPVLGGGGANRQAQAQRAGEGDALKGRCLQGVAPKNGLFRWTHETRAIGSGDFIATPDLVGLLRQPSAAPPFGPKRGETPESPAESGRSDERRTTVALCLRRAHLITNRI
jgi:hypothetical protein